MKPMIIACAFALAFAFGAAVPSRAADAPTAIAAPAAPKLHAAMRELWQGHAKYTRDYALAVKAGDAAATKKAADDVVANAKQIADAVASYYGADAGKRMLELLAGHWGGVKALTDADKAGDKDARAKAMQDLTSNADQIAQFLSGANPNLPADAVRGLLMTHACHHSALVAEIMKGDAKSEATTWTAMQAHMNALADALASGIAKQFPAKAT